MTKNQAAKKLMDELQKGITSGETHSWILEEEATQLLDADENEADRQIFDAAMAAHLKDPITYSLDEVGQLLGLDEIN